MNEINEINGNPQKQVAERKRQRKKNGKQVVMVVVVVVVSSGGVWWGSEINKLKVDGNTYYLAINHAVLSTRESYQTVKVFSIEKNQLNDKVKLIKTKSGLQNELGFDFDFFYAL